MTYMINVDLETPNEAPELWVGHPSAFGMTTTALGTPSMRSWRGCGRSPAEHRSVCSAVSEV